MIAQGVAAKSLVRSTLGLVLWFGTTSLAAQDTDVARGVSYSRDIAPLVDTHCVVCHQPGGIGPFSLRTQDDVTARAPQILRAIERGVMPPWKPRSGAGQFAFRGERRLREREIDRIRQWVEAGTPQDALPVDPSPHPTETGWQAGVPDLVVTMSESYPLLTGVSDVYRNFVLPIPIRQDRFVRAIELRAATAGAVHHARLMIDRTGSAGRLDNADPLPGYDAVHTDQARFPDGHFLGWAPGTIAGGVPEELAWRLEPGSDLVLKTHLVATGVQTAVQVSVGMFFTDMPPTKRPVVIQLGSQTLEIPAGVPDHVVEDTYQVPTDVDVLAVYPHAHFLASRVGAVVQFPDGTDRSLIQIDDWDFNWQDEYRYQEPVRVPAGSTIVMRYLFDNSSGNPQNPNRPPRAVTFGPRSTDEMAELSLQVMPVDADARPLLAADAGRKVSRILLAGAQKQLADSPADAAHYENAAVHLVALGRAAEAIDLLEVAAQIAPQRATVRYRLGTALTVDGRTDEALRQFRDAVRLDPDFTEAHNNLGGLLQLAGETAEAATHYRRTLELNPAHAGAHFNLANLLLDSGRVEEAVSAFRNAIVARPNFAEAYMGLGRALTVSGRPDEARDAFARARSPRSR